MYDFDQFLQLPDEQQHEQMREWLSSIVEAEEKERQEKIRKLFSEISELDMPDKSKVIEKRILALIELPVDRIKTFARSRYRAMQELSEIDESDRATVIGLMQQMPEHVQQTIAQVLMELRDELDSRA